jgi:hypothetical protein
MSSLGDAQGLTAGRHPTDRKPATTEYPQDC